MRKHFLILTVLLMMLTPAALAQPKQGGLSFQLVKSALEAGAVTHMSAVPETQNPESDTQETPGNENVPENVTPERGNRGGETPASTTPTGEPEGATPTPGTQTGNPQTQGTPESAAPTPETQTREAPVSATPTPNLYVPASVEIPLQAEVYRAAATVTTNNVNVRTGPGYSYLAFTQVHRGTSVTVEQRCKADGITWYYGKMNGFTGWIHGGFLSFIDVETPLPAQVPVTFTGYVRLDSTNVRTGPGMSNTVITQVNRGAVFEVTSSVNVSGTTWYFGTCGYVQGWIRGDLITATPIITPVPAPTTPAPCVIPTEGQMNYVNYSAYVRVSSAEVRSGAGQSNALICNLPYGTQVQVLATTYCRNMNLWCYVEYAPNAYGYIIESSLASYTPTAVPQVCVTAAPGYSIDYSDAFVGYTAMSKVLVRVTPGGDAIQRIEIRGTQVQVQGSTWYGNIKWYLVSYYGGTGFIRYDMITTRNVTNAPTIEPGGYESPVNFSGMTTKNKCNVRSAPTFNSTVIDSLSYGTYLNVFGMQYDASGNTWYHVLYGNGKYGYIHASLVTAYDEAAVRRYYDSQTAKPTVKPTTRSSSLSDNNSSMLHAPRTSTPRPTATPKATAAPTTPSYFFVTAVPTALPTAGRVTEMLEFTPVTLSKGQTLPVYSAPSSAAWRSDNGTAVLTTNRSLWVAGFEGQWMLVLYTNENSQIRVGYINAFRLSGALPTANTLLFAPESVRLNRAVNLTSDPLGSSEVMLSLSAGSEVTLLCACNLGSAWAYVETTVNGMPVRGFVPSSAVGP